ncbi:hypothetical protein KP509_20G064000 [Ceratopteris richardii]|nr:hypothetical protein KP509_20G064000 [Ceratopteris richardii]
MLLKVGIVGASSHRYAIIIGTSCSVIAALLTACIVIAVLRKKRKEKALDDEGFLQELPRLPTRYTYKELHAVTNGFAIKLGEGGFGEVYQGTLVSGTKVAVKMLQTTSKHSFAQFRSEVASIGIASHMNLVTLLGFCHSAEGKLLVYEYMTMGSLDRWLFGEGHKLGWGRRCKIAMDAARGLAYLHHECGQKVVHCDIKPENILLDDNFNAKIGDFGLAKLIEQDRQSFNMTTLKGTRGYLAPEWLQDAVITPRSDVYSFGVVLLELVTGHRCLEGNAGYLPTMAFRIVSESASASSMEVSLPWLASGERSRGDDSGETQPPPQPMCLRVVESCGSKMGALFDRRLSQDADMALASVQRMIFIALWCVQPDPTVRPPMNVVLQMLEGTLHVPPPLLQQTTRSMNSSSGFTSETTDTGTIESQPLIWSHPNTCLD